MDAIEIQREFRRILLFKPILPLNTTIKVVFGDQPNVVAIGRHESGALPPSLTFTVKPSWETDVYAKGLVGVVRDSVAIDALRLEDRKGCEVWKITYVLAKRNVSLIAQNMTSVARRGDFIATSFCPCDAAALLNRSIAIALGIDS